MRRVDLLEVPGVFQVHEMAAHGGLGRDLADVAGDALGQRLVPRAVDQLEAVDRQAACWHSATLGRQRCQRSILALVEGRAEKADDDTRLRHQVVALLACRCFQLPLMDGIAFHGGFG